MNATPDQTVPTEQDTKPVHVAPVRPDGWPDWLGRRPMTTADRKTLRETIETGLPETVTTTGGPFLCYLTIDGLNTEPDPRKATRLRGRVHAPARTAAEHRRTTYHATDSTITIGIFGPDAHERINKLHTTVTTLAAKHSWTIRQQPR
jgi:pyrrolidone-carboxylate peptidase